MASELDQVAAEQPAEVAPVETPAAPRPFYDATYKPAPGGNFFDQFDDDKVVELRASPGWEPSFVERWTQNFQNALDWSPERGAKFLLERNQADPLDAESAIRRQRDKELEFEQMAGSDSLLDYVAALGGQLAGAASVPSTYVAAPFKFLSGAYRASRPIAARAIEQGVSAGVANVATDVAAQGLRIAADVQDEYRPLQTVLAAGLGTAIGGSVGALGAKIDLIREQRFQDQVEMAEARLANYFDQFDGQAPVTREELATLAPGARLAEDVEATPARMASEAVEQPLAREGEDVAAPQLDASGGPARAVSGPADSQAMIRQGAVPPAQTRAAGRVQGQPTEHLEDIVEQLIEAAPDATAFRQGRMSQRAPAGSGGTVAGQFGNTSGVVRVRHVSDLEAVTHEIAHAWEARREPGLDALMQQHRGELERLAYPGTPAGRELSEGFAEFTRYLVTNPAYAQAQAPNFTQAFRAWMHAAHPERWMTITDVQGRYQNWLNMPSGAAVASDIVSDREPGVVRGLSREVQRNGFLTTLNSWAHRLYEMTFDKLHPLDRAVDELLRIYAANRGQRLDLRASDNAYKLARLATDSSAAGMIDMLHGVVPHRGVVPEGPSLYGALNLALGQRMVGRWDADLLQEFGAYLVSRRAIHEYGRFARGEIPNPPGKFTLEDYRQAVATFEADHPQWAQAAGLVYEWQNNLLRKKFQAGFLTQEQYDAFRQMPDYVPFQRDMSDFGDEVGRPAGAGGVSPGKTGRAGIVNAFRGSQRSIINPLESIMRDALETANLIARNEVFSALDNLAHAAGPGGGSIAERIPANQMQAQQVNVAEAIEAAARQHNLNPRDAQLLRDAADSALGNNMTVTVFRPGDINEAGEPILYVWRNGRRQPIRLADGDFGRELYAAMTGLGKQQREWLIDVIGLPTAMMQAGITKTPEFIMANYLRDQLSAWVLGGERFIPFLSGARGVVDEVTQSDMARMYAQAGGIFGGAQTAGLHSARVERDIQALRKRGYFVNRLSSIKGLFELSEVSESGTRLALFRAGYDRARSQGLSEYEALIEAAYTARDYMDFGRHGSKMIAARRIVPFLNAALQGLDKSARTLIAPYFKHRAGLPMTAAERRELGTATRGWAKVAAIGLFGLGLRALYKDDPQYEEVSDYIRATHWVIMGDGGRIYTIPKPFELAALSNVFERAFEYAYKDDPRAWERLRSDLYETVVPPHRVPALNIPYEMATNYSFFKDAPIVPDNLRGLEPALQWNAYTSELGKKIGAALNVSPIYVDHAITGFSGTWGRSVLGWSNFGRPNQAETGPEDEWITRRFIKDVSRGATSSRQFWDLIAAKHGEWDRVAQSYHQMQENATLGSADAYLQGKDEGAVAYALLNHHFDSNAKRAHPLRRAKDAILTLSKLRQEMVLDRIITSETAEDAPEDQAQIRLTPHVKGQVDDVLSRLSMMEARNALIAADARGWAQKEVMDTAPVWKELKAASPEMFDEVEARYAKAKVYSEAGVRKQWPAIQERLLKERSEAYIGDLVTDAKYGD